MDVGVLPVAPEESVWFPHLVQHDTVQHQSLDGLIWTQGFSLVQSVLKRQSFVPPEVPEETLEREFLNKTK